MDSILQLEVGVICKTKSVLGRVRSACMLVLRLYNVIVASQHVVHTIPDKCCTRHDFVKTVWPQAYE